MSESVGGEILSVVITFPIFFCSDDVCGYTIYKWNSEMPFKAVLLDRQSGDAKIVLNDGFQLDYETKHKYTFDIAAYDCASGKHATRLTKFTQVSIQCLGRQTTIYVIISSCQNDA